MSDEASWADLRPILQNMADPIARIERFLAASGLQSPSTGSGEVLWRSGHGVPVPVHDHAEGWRMRGGELPLPGVFLCYHADNFPWRGNSPPRARQLSWVRTPSLRGTAIFRGGHGDIP